MVLHCSPELGPGIGWLHSDITGDKTCCIRNARDEALLEAHAGPSGLPANQIAEVKSVIDPGTAG